LKHKKLPHISMRGYYQFVTFRTYDSIDEYLKKLYASNTPNSLKQSLIDKYLDSSNNGAIFYNKILKITKDYILKKDKEIYDLISFTIMPNHIHILFKEVCSLDKTMHILKGGLAYLINRELNKSGKIFANSYYDKLIRDEKHFETVYNYIKNNPIKANLKDFKERYYSIFE